MIVDVDVFAEQLGPDPEPGVVDQEVDRLTGAGESLGDPEHVLAYAEVGDERLDADPVLVLEQAAVSVSRSALRATSTRSSPRAARARANAAPMPEVPPVINAVVMVTPYGRESDRRESVVGVRTQQGGGFAGDGQFLVGRDHRDLDRRAVGGDDPGRPSTGHRSARHRPRSRAHPDPRRQRHASAGLFSPTPAVKVSTSSRPSTAR